LLRLHHVASRALAIATANTAATMGKDDYASTGLPPSPTPPLFLAPSTASIADILLLTGGALKLKGVKDAGIKKKKKKKATSKQSASAEPSTDTDVQPHSDSVQKGEHGEEEEDPWAGKTEAERKFEQRRQEQLEKRLAKEGIKTHKERVEEYNKYLASLSEHHDMYVAPSPFTPPMESCYCSLDTDCCQAEDRTRLTGLVAVAVMVWALEMGEL
jgi:protein FAM32A